MNAVWCKYFINLILSWHGGRCWLGVSWFNYSTMLIHHYGDISSHSISFGPSGLNDRIHSPVEASLCPCHTVFPSYCTMYSCLLKVTVHPALMSVLIEIKDVCASFGHICAFLATARSPGISISPSCVVSSHPLMHFSIELGCLLGAHSSLVSLGCKLLWCIRNRHTLVSVLFG